MFDLDLTDEQAALAEVTGALARGRLRPAARQAETERAVPGAVVTAVHQLGLLDAVPTAAGGDGLADAITLLLAVEELAVGDPAITFALAGSGMTARVVGHLGSDAQQRALLAPFLTGPARGSLYLYEGFGRRPRDLETTASPRGDGGWRLEGAKVAVIDPTAAALSVVIARRADTGELAAFAVPGTLLGTVARDDAETGAISLLPARTATVALAVDLDAAALLDAPSHDVNAAVALARLANVAIALGCSRAALDYAAGYATERQAFGKPIASFQGVSFPIVDAQMATELARLDLWQVATTLEHGDEVDRERDVDRVVTTAGEVVAYATRTAVQVLGGHGFLTDHPVERWYRAGAALTALDFDPLDVPVAIGERTAE